MFVFLKPWTIFNAHPLIRRLIVTGGFVVFLGLAISCVPGVFGEGSHSIPALTQRPAAATPFLFTATENIRPSATFTPSATSTETPSPSLTTTSLPSQTPSTTMTPESLLAFTSRWIRPGIEPQSYITDTCKYLALRWSPAGSPPGTVVIPIMFHGIRASGGAINDSVTITEGDFQSFVQYARTQGFATITTQQLIGFLYRNERIPPRSMLMIVDDKRPGTVETHFLPVLEQYGWTVTLGWIIAGTDDALWQRMERLYATGRLDVQSHGYLHQYITEFMPDDQVRREIFDPIPVLEAHFGQRPLAFIWPGGNFTALSVRLARQAGYQLGFTASSHGPLLFNWIPQGDAERAAQDPLMLLPRGWSTALGVNLDVAVKVGEQSRAFAIQQYPQEAKYFRTYCGGELPALEAAIPATPTP